MKYPKEYLDEIKARLKVSTVVSKSVNLKKRGKEFVGISPFKNEKTPSFTVNDEKGFYHCFSSGEHGNIFDFLIKTQNLKFGEAVRSLASMVGMRPYLFTKEDLEREKNFKTYVSIITKYSNVCHNNLIQNKNNKISNYLKNRSLDINIIKKFCLGFADFNQNLFDDFKKEHDEKDLKSCGLFYYDENKKTYIERFRNRLIFPIKNITGNIIALGGRIIEKKDFLAKYVNSPETPYFRKGSNLYNLDVARTYSNKVENIYIVEGYMDVIGLTKNGINNVVANLGTALTEKQILILNQYFNNIIICFDGDQSGKNAALRAAENCIINLQPDKNISFLFLPEGEDPDSYINKNGKKFFQNFSKENLISIYDFIFSSYQKDTDKSPSSLAKFEKKLRGVANSIKDQFIKKYVLNYFLEKISDLTPNLNFKSNNKFKFKKSLDITQKIYNETKTLPSIQIKEYSLLCIILENLNFFNNNQDLLNEINLFTDENKIIFSKLTNEVKKGRNLSKENLEIDPQILDKIYKFSSIKHILKNKKFDDQEIINLIEECKRDLKNHELELRIEELEAKFSSDFNEKTFNELKNLKKLQKIN